MKIHFLADEYKETARDAMAALVKKYGQTALDKAEVVVPVGGDGTLLAALAEAGSRHVYGVVPPNNQSTGFTMNPYNEDSLLEDINGAGYYTLVPLRVTFYQAAESGKIEQVVRHAFNTASLVRDSAQAASLTLTHRHHQTPSSIKIGGDGIAFSTPLGSTGLNFSSGGAIVDLPARQTVITGLNLFAPRTLKSLVVSNEKTDFALEWDKGRGKRPLRLEVDGQTYRDLENGIVTIEPEKDSKYHVKVGLSDEKSSLFGRLSLL